MPLPADISEGDALVQLLAALLVERDLDEALTGSSVTCTWHNLANGLRQWLLWEHSDLPSQSRFLLTISQEMAQRAKITPRLASLAPFTGDCTHNDPSEPWTLSDSVNPTSATEEAVTVVDYAMSTYGRDKLPRLLNGIQRYDTWEALIPTVFGVSAAEFEAGWQEYYREDEFR